MGYSPRVRNRPGMVAPPPPPAPVTIKVTPTERLVLVELTRDGPTNGIIALRMGVTEDTIKTHFRHIMHRVMLAGSPLCESRSSLIVGLLRGLIKTTTVTQVNPRDPSGGWDTRRRKAAQSVESAHGPAAVDPADAPDPVDGRP